MTKHHPPFRTPSTIPWWLGVAVMVVVIVLAITFCTPRARANPACGGHMLRMAQDHANKMAAQGPRCTYARLNHDGFFSRRGPAGARAENVACASSEAQAIAMWWKSPGHARNMRLGGCWAIARNGRYWVLEIGD